MNKVFTISIPQYITPSKIFGKSNFEKYDITPWFGVNIPKYYFDNIPDFKSIGAKIDNLLRYNFLDKDLVIRCIGSIEHPTKTQDELINIILTTGTDRYDPNRKGDRYENNENKKIDFFALSCHINQKDEYMVNFLEPFYFWPIVDRGFPVKVDIITLYNPNHLEVVEHTYKGRENETKRDAFVFKYPQKKSEAVVGIIKII